VRFGAFCSEVVFQTCFNRYLFVDFRNENEASAAITAMNNHPFDAKHTFKLNHFTDIERYADMNETYIEPETEEYTPRVPVQQSSDVPILILCCRSTSVLGWLILKDGINMSYIVAKRYRYIGTGSRHSVN